MEPRYVVTACMFKAASFFRNAVYHLNLLVKRSNPHRKRESLRNFAKEKEQQNDIKARLPPS